MVRRQPVFEAWIAETGQARLDLLEDILSDEEQARGRQFHRQELREQHVVAHALKRLCIAKRLGGLDPRELRFATQASGKPILLDALIDFSLSHSRGVCAVALSRLGPCGVDIEVRGAGRYLSPALLKTMTVKEQERILAAGDPYAAFVECWVVKEAYAKLTGLGLAEQFNKLCAEQVFDGSGSEFGNLRESFLWRRQFDRYCIAVCVTGPSDGTWHGNIHSAPEGGFSELTASGYEFTGEQRRAGYGATVKSG